MTIDTDLATLRRRIPASRLERVSHEALDRVEAELARLRQERNEYAERLAWHREERDVYMKGNVWVRRAAEELERAETAERELARLREGLREPLGLLQGIDYDEGSRIDRAVEGIEALLADTPDDGAA